MLQELSRFYQRLLIAADALLVLVGWTVAYYVRFYVLADAGPLTPPIHVPIERYLGYLPWVVVVSVLVFWSSGLYAPDRAQRISRMVYSIAKAVGLGLLVLTATLSFNRSFYFSRLHMILFGLITPFLMIGLRGGIYLYLRHARRQGRFIKRVLIVGAGRAGKRLADVFRRYPWMGFEVVGFLDDYKEGPEVLGTTSEAGSIADRMQQEDQPIDFVYIALPFHAVERTEDLLATFSTRLAHVYLVPDLFQYDILNSRITDVDGMPVIHLIDEAPIEFRRVLKRAMDLVLSALFLVAISPLMLLISIAVKLSSPGPVFYRQERMSLNGHRFEMLKFRSMPVDAEKETGPTWAKKGESRATGVGQFLRRTSLDELPQFINVLRGEMSIVGPRPERPVFIEEFKSEIPGYMLRHKTKAGITGWAQVNGWRGNTSLEKRIEHDLYYIQNWSLALDLKIMILTFLRGFRHENAY